MAGQVQRGHGGDWTRLKLECLEGYLKAYNQALKNFPFRRIYIDAFSGTGEPYQLNKAASRSRDENSLEINLQVDEPQIEFFDGSVRRALSVPNGFHSFKLIEQRRKNVSKLRELAEEPQHKELDIEIIQGDANTAILDLCRNIDWHGRRHPSGQRHRAVLFLDPFGCQVDWSTIQAVARTKAIDMWYLFPSSAVIRQVPKNKPVPPSWKMRLDRCLGGDEWMEAFYEEVTTKTLFDFDFTNRNRIASFSSIEKFLIKSLEREFVAVNPTCLPLDNMQGSQLFSLCFAAGNPAGKETALNIAGWLIDHWAKRRR
ncbi:three-Cys-motif partner protein TcmP [Azospirillum brasilense]|uniref:three-Cys-motif partner protein TcmP n=1 Tax=Azospirillum brasilense TaxID=192 RepID=UPI000E679CF2|nr:three-Cys-motif partner protein TcmP [Azospirillum brasilense]NUB26257.1 three-Cys-motif partner protein TcmP [Azospirillum brasilense]NUB34231.1 three-Cys-motif partner protein TcmP [Azospirillum brasilense]RIV99243.1 three-Cys-motif partner protein TcmP [Azospirillum brasilense]